MRTSNVPFRSNINNFRDGDDIGSEGSEAIFSYSGEGADGTGCGGGLSECDR